MTKNVSKNIVVSNIGEDTNDHEMEPYEATGKNLNEDDTSDSNLKSVEPSTSTGRKRPQTSDMRLISQRQNRGFKEIQSVTQKQYRKATFSFEIIRI